jgi:hypothetical protein
VRLFLPARIRLVFGLRFSSFRSCPVRDRLSRPGVAGDAIAARIPRIRWVMVNVCPMLLPQQVYEPIGAFTRGTVLVSWKPKPCGELWTQ